MAEYRGTVDLLDYWRLTPEGTRKLSQRKLLVAIEQLPLDCRVKRALNKVPILTEADMVAATFQIINELRALRYTTIAVNRQKGSPKPQDPVFIDMPEPRTLSPGIEQMLRAQREYAEKESRKKRFANVADIHLWIKNLQTAAK